MKTIHKILITLGLVLLCFAGCEGDLTGVKETDSSPVNSEKTVFIQFKGGTDTSFVCNKIVYDILRGEKITFYNDTETTTILINQIMYFNYE